MVHHSFLKNQSLYDSLSNLLMHAQWLRQEEQTFADHNQQQETIWQKHSRRLTDIVKNNEGVWISTKVLYIVGSLSLLSIITIAIEIAFYVISTGFNNINAKHSS